MIANSLHIDGMKALPVNKVAFILAWCDYADLRPVDATDYPREPFSSVKPVLVFVDSGCSCWPLYKLVLL